MRVVAVGRPDVPDLQMPARFQSDISYFMTPSGEGGAPELALGEYWISPEDARRWLDELVIEVISPLSAEVKAEVEIDEDQERWLEWLLEHGVQRIRLERS